MKLPIRGSVVKRLLIIVPVVVLGLILVSLFMPARRVSIEGVGKVSFETTVTLSVGSEVAYASPVEITRFVKTDSTERSRTSSSAVEETNYTITWSNLTGAGLAAGDDVIIMVFAALRCNNANQYVRFQVGFGTSYAGRVNEADSYTSLEPIGAAANNNSSYFWIDRRTLVTDENIYFSLWSITTYIGYSDEFRVVVLKLADLQSTDFLYAETAPSGDAPTDYATGAGASANTGATGDWLFFGMTRWLDDSATAGNRAGMVIDVDGINYSEIQREGEDGENSWDLGTIAYRVGLASGKTARVRYRVITATTHDCVATKIFGLRLDAFKDHWGAHTTNTITHSVIDTYQSFASKSDYSASQTGNVLALGLPIHTFTDAAKIPYGRILLDATEWPSSGFNRVGYRDNGAAAKTGPWVFGYASVSSGTRNFNFQCAEDADISPTYNCTEQIAIIFSMELAVAAEPDISVSPTSHNFVTVTESSTLSTTTTYFAIDNNSTIQTDHTISVTTNTWSGGVPWTHSDIATPGPDTAGLLANRGGAWGTGDIIVKYIDPNYIYENCPIGTDYSFGLKLLAPTSFSDGAQKQIIVRITAVAG